jgi:ABC-type sulfate/molybdate transport systems ATPase subunit
VISHDDRYFGEADRLVFMEQGRVREVQDKDASLTAKLAHTEEAVSMDNVLMMDHTRKALSGAVAQRS